MHSISTPTALEVAAPTTIDKTSRAAHGAVCYPSLSLETRPCISTEQAAYYLNRRPQTLRWWACYDMLPPGLDVKRVNGRLAWNTDSVRKVLGVSK